jgi:hypothetical protein
MGYISSSANRWYCAQETAYGQIPAITAANRIPAVKLNAQQQRAKSQRKDKTGSRTWGGLPAGVRRQTTFGLTSYMMDWADQTALPPHGALISAAMGGFGYLWAGGTVAAGTDSSNLKFAAPHGLNPGQAVVFNGEIRFVAAVADALTVVLNTPFSTAPIDRSSIGAAASYGVARELPSVSLFDYWDPATSVQRIITGAAVDRMSVSLNADFHEFEFRGSAQDIVDNASFAAGQGGIVAFPAEPAGASSFTYSPVPGNLGQVWLGAIPTQFFTLAAASVEIRNNLNTRSNEFGSMLPQSISPGVREVTVSLELFGQDEAATIALYQAARQQSPMSVMFQLGQTNGQLMGIYLKSLIPDVPVFDDAETRLKWKFSDTRAQGTTDDEIVVAFG